MIALITCYFQHNYGSQLQAYATQLLLDRMGIPNETIRIDGLRPEITRRKMHYFLRRILFWDTWTDKWPVVHKLLTKRLRPAAFRRNWAIRNRIFEQFAATMFHLSPVYSSTASLGRQPYQAFVVGSDQLWLPSNIEADYYTLNYVPESVPKIAFATSFGVDCLPPRQARMASAFLSRFDDIMVRELQGRDLVRTLTGKEALVACDPVLCLTRAQWEEVTPAARLIGQPYIFCHFLGNRTENRRWAQRVKELTGRPVVMMPHCDDYVAADEALADEKLYEAGPFELIRLIRDADYVLTDSYHTTAFSILFEKPFFTFPRYRKDDSTSTNGRLRSLLAEMDLESRYLMGREPVEDCLKQEIDYTETEEQLGRMRRETCARLQHDLKAL